MKEMSYTHQQWLKRSHIDRIWQRRNHFETKNPKWCEYTIKRTRHFGWNQSIKKYIDFSFWWWRRCHIHTSDGSNDHISIEHKSDEKILKPKSQNDMTKPKNTPAISAEYQLSKIYTETYNWSWRKGHKYTSDGSNDHISIEHKRDKKILKPKNQNDMTKP